MDLDGNAMEPLPLALAAPKELLEGRKALRALNVTIGETSKAQVATEIPENHDPLLAAAGVAEAAEVAEEAALTASRWAEESIEERRTSSEHHLNNS